MLKALTKLINLLVLLVFSLFAVGISADRWASCDPDENCTPASGQLDVFEG